MLGKYYELRNPVMERQTFKNQQLHVQKVNEIFNNSSKFLQIQEKDEEQRIQSYFTRKAYHNKFINQEKYFYQSQEDKSLRNKIGEIKFSKKQKSTSQNFPISLNETFRKLNDQKIRTENYKIQLRIVELTSKLKDKDKIKKDMTEYFKMKHHISKKRKNLQKLPPIEPREIKLTDRNQQQSQNKLSSTNIFYLNSSLNTSKQDQSKINEQEVVKKLKDMEKQSEQQENVNQKEQDKENQPINQQKEVPEEQKDIKKEPLVENQSEQQQQQQQVEPTMNEEKKEEKEEQQVEEKKEQNETKSIVNNEQQQPVVDQEKK